MMESYSYVQLIKNLMCFISQQEIVTYVSGFFSKKYIMCIGSAVRYLYKHPPIQVIKKQQVLLHSRKSVGVKKFNSKKYTYFITTHSIFNAIKFSSCIFGKTSFK